MGSLKWVILQVSEESDPPAQPTRKRPLKSNCSDDNLAARVTAKLEEGDVKGAVRLASSEDSIAKRCDATLASLREKHLPPHPQSIIPPCPTSSDASHITLSEEDILRSIMSFPNGSAGGPDGLRPQHLKDLISTSAGAGGPVLLRALTDLVNIIVPVLLRALTDLVNIIVPVLLRALTDLVNIIVPVLLRALTDLVNIIVPVLLRALTDLVNIIVPVLLRALTDLVNIIVPVLLRALTDLVNIIVPVLLRALTDLVNIIVPVLLRALTDLVNIIVPVLLRALTDLVNIIVPVLLRALTDLVKIIVPVLLRALTDLVNIIVPVLLRALTDLVNIIVPVLLRALTDLVNIIVKGDTPSSISPFFFGASLITLEKKGGGVRPIAIGCTLWRLAAKAIGSQLKSRMGDLLAPRQLGYRTPHGCEAVVHAVRMYLHHLSPDNAILKLDFSNTFNSIRRDMLKAVQDLAPELLHVRFVHSVYSAPSTLFWEDECLLSCEGVQQEDPLGPLLFFLTLHQLSLQLRSELCLFYLDDGTLGGSEDDIVHDLDVINNAADELGLMLNMQKCELITCSSTIKDSILSVSPQLQVTMPDSVSLLGSPLADIDCISDIIQLKVSDLETMGIRLQRMHAHDALQLLRHSFALPKMMHILRTTPCFLSSCLTGYDDLLRSILSGIVNVNFQENDLTWTQATLPVKCGGLGIRSAVQLAPSTFLASAAGTSNLIHQILPPRFTGIPYSGREDALSCWSLGHSE